MSVPLRLVLAALFAFGLSATAPSRHNARVFDRTWSLVAKHFWQADRLDLDGPAVRDQYRERAVAAPDDARLYAILNQMLARLGNSHVYATPPAPAGDPPRAPRPNRAERLDGGVLLLGFDHFVPGDDRWVARQLATRPTGVILDLRHNGGGRDDVLDRIAGLFIDRNRLLVTLRAKRVIEEWTRGAGPDSYAGPLALLVGPRTASAAEILASFLDEQGRACSLGQPTRGAVDGGVDYHLPGGGRLTIARYDVRTASGIRLEGQGFSPRLAVAPGGDGTDPVRDRAVAVLTRTIMSGRQQC